MSRTSTMETRYSMQLFHSTVNATQVEMRQVKVQELHQPKYR
ncbi:Protein of unknown function [Pyronema omphalodes CBS 100304]|uniref:Uncharacterized protein n=1 Tax=Pyronema omphalodes (strain CBS 100304) TaxID=1076935 RepID=U4L1U7_PYROM|nr:Protein of unknown function [Pyronema omphalodes CBS 100304]